MRPATASPQPDPGCYTGLLFLAHHHQHRHGQAASPPWSALTLPLISYGGSSLLTVLCVLGLLMNVSIRRYSY